MPTLPPRAFETFFVGETGLVQDLGSYFGLPANSVLFQSDLDPVPGHRGRWNSGSALWQRRPAHLVAPAPP
jgi:hypothetical protein